MSLEKTVGPVKDFLKLSFLSRPLLLRVMPHRGLSSREPDTTEGPSLRPRPPTLGMLATAAMANPLDPMLNLKPISEANFAW